MQYKHTSILKESTNPLSLPIQMFFSKQYLNTKASEYKVIWK